MIDISPWFVNFSCAELPALWKHLGCEALFINENFADVSYNIHFKELCLVFLVLEQKIPQTCLQEFSSVSVWILLHQLDYDGLDIFVVDHVLPRLGQARQVRYNVTNEIKDGVVVKVTEHSKNTFQYNVMKFLISFDSYQVFLSSFIGREVGNKHKRELNELLVGGDLQNFPSL